MDLRSWRKVLLQWISECNFMERNYFNIEQTNIDVFFTNFCSKHNAAKGFNSITAFLEEHYPEFQLNIDDENTLSTGDYIYVYSLLLHFSCVKCPDESFHGICKKLGEQAQQCIAAFFELLIGCASMKKEDIRHAIAEVAATYIFSPPGQQSKNASVSSSGSGGAISIDLQTSFSSSPIRVNNDSNTRTPNRKALSVSDRISPGTPKSTLLEERTRELYKYKAQLETERYEKGLLEFQIIQNEQQICNLNSIQKRLRQQIQSLKDEYLNQSVEPNKYLVEDDQIQNQLHRKINEREDEIFRLNDRIRIFGEEKSLLENKLRHAENKILDYRETISELELKLNEFATDMEKKDSIIKCLTDDKAELEHFIAETRTASSNSRPDFNSSGDCLDSSFARYTNSSGSLGSPENLGASVVDVQLREKEHENAQLREELTELNSNNKKLSNYIKEKIEIYKKEFNLDIIDLEATNDIEDPSRDFSYFLDCMNHLSLSYKDSKEYVKQLEVDISSLQEKNVDLKANLEASKLEIQNFNDNISKLTEENEKLKNERDNLEKLKKEISQSSKKMIKELNEKLKESITENEKLSSHIEGLNEKIHLQMRRIENLDIQVTKEETCKLDFQMKVEELETELFELKGENKNLEDTADILNSKLQSEIELGRLMNEKNQKLQIENDVLLQKANETNAHLQTLSNDIKNKEENLKKLSEEFLQNYNEEKTKWEKENLNLQENLTISETKLRDIESEMEGICKEIKLLYSIVLKEENNNFNAILTLKEINEIVKQMLINKEELQSKIDELENIKKENNEKLQEIENKLQKEIEINNERLCQHKAEIKEINEESLKAASKIEDLEKLLNDMENKSQETIGLERKRTEDLQKLHEKLLLQQKEERQSWENKQNQLEAELNGEKEIYAAKVQEFSKAQLKLESYEMELRELKCNQNKTEKDYFERLTAAEAKVDLLVKENEALKTILNNQSEELISKTNEVSSYVDKYNQTVNALKIVKLEQENMEKAMKNMEIDYETKIVEIKETIETITNEKLELETLLKKEKEMLVIKVQELAVCNDAYNKTLFELETAQVNLKDIKENIEKAQNNFSALENDLESKHMQLKKENEELRSENQVLETKFKAEEEMRMIQQKETYEKLERIEEIYNTLEILKKEKDEIEKNMIERVEKTEKYGQSLLLKADSDIMQLKSELQKTIEELEKRNKELQEVRNMLQNISEKLENEMKISKSLKLSNENQSKELEKLQKKVLQSQETQHQQYLELDSLQIKHKNQSDELFDLYEELANVKEDLKHKMDHIHKLETDLQKAKSILEQHYKCANEVIGLNKKLESMECKQSKMNAELEQVSKKNAETEKQSEKWNEIIKDQEQKIEQLRDLLRQTELCLKNVNDECTKSQGEVVAKEAEIRMLYDEIKQMKVLLKSQDNASEIVKDFEQDINDVLNLLLNSSIISNLENSDPIINDNMTKDNNNRQCIDRLKIVVNQALIAIDQQNESLLKIPNLESRINELNDQQANTLKNLKVLQSQFRASQSTIKDLEDQKKLLEKKLDTECKRFADDLQNLELVNEKLTRENESFHRELLNKTADLETLQINFGILKEVNERLTTAQAKLEVEYNKTIETLNGKQIRLEELMKAKDQELEKLQKELDELQRCAKDEDVVKQQKYEIIHSELKQSISEKTNQLQELKAKQEEYTLLIAENEELNNKNAELNTQAIELQKECISLRAELSALNEKLLCTNEELTTSLDQIEEASANCNAYYEKLEKLNAKYTLLECNFKEIEGQLNNSNNESAALMIKYKTLTEEKQNLTEELNLNKREIHELKQTIHNLNQKLALGDLEKDDLRRQLELLHKQVEVNSRYQTTSESKLKNIVETSQALERNLLCSENALKTVRATLEQSKGNVEKLETENQKLSHSLDSINKRLEKLALKLGESQAQTSKSERENDKLTKLIETQKATIETLQREKDVQQLECKTLKERLNRMEQQLARVQNAEKSNTSLIAEKQRLENEQVDLKAKLTKLRNSCQMNEERLRKMTHNYERYERENVNLNHQIGALNNEIKMLKCTANDEKNSQISELNRTITEIRLQSKTFEELNQKLSSEYSNLQQQNQMLTDQLSKVVLALEISKAKSDQFGTEVQQLESDIKKLNQEKISMEQAQSNIIEQTETHKRLYETAISEKRELEQKIQFFENNLTTKDAEIRSLRAENNELRQNSTENLASLADKASKLVSEVESLRTRLHATEVMLEKEQENNAKLRSDNQILLAKYQDAKQRIEAEISSSEERIKENRLELEGKLEKMKNKMKVLYTEEVTKMKARQERETTKMRSELSHLKSQNTKYQEHTQKLSKELMTVNDRMLECQKQNTYLMTKLKYAQNEDKQFKRPNSTLSQTSTGIATIPRISSVQSIPTNIGTDLAMEDEEGEIFNNTYLTDMKNGRMSEIAPEELQHRNSLLPPHLKSSYAIQYDHGLCEDEVKDGTSNILDDSMSALLNSNSSCIRKKLIGVTHYWKPGPPTPSKNGGRLSLGGNSEPSREILKESYDANTPTSTKTPARFAFFASRFSLGNINSTRDENEEEDQQQQQQQQEQQHLFNNNHQQDRQKLFVTQTKIGRKDLRRILQIKNMEKFQSCKKNEKIVGGTNICTSTPRKSRGRIFDRRCLIQEIRKESSSASCVDTLNSSHEMTPLEISNIETPTFSNVRNSRRQSITFLKRSIKGTRRISVGSSTIAVITALQRRIRKGVRRERDQGTRPSLCVNKNLYTSKVCTPQRGAIRDLKRIMGRKNRMLRFDKQRMLTNMNTSSSTAEVSDTDIEYTEEHEIAQEETIPVVDNATFAIKNTNHATVVVATNKLESSDKKHESICIEQNDFYDNSDGAKSITVSDIEIKTNPCLALTNTSTAKIIPTLHLDAQQLNNELERLQEEEIYSEKVSATMQFEQLLKETVSQAPFEIRSIRLSSIGAAHSDSGMTSTATSSITNSSSTDHRLIDRTNSNKNSFSSSTAVFGMTSKRSIKSNTCDTPYTTVTATPHQSPLSPSSSFQHSRTIYGASVVVNPRIPNVDGLRVRKSSIYFKNPKCSTFRSSYGLSAIDSNITNQAAFSQEGDLILVTNQTITLYDLICMWQQMNVWTRLIIFTILSGSMGAILTLMGFLYFKS